MWITYKNIKYSYKSKDEKRNPFLEQSDVLLGIPRACECLIIKNEKGSIFDGTFFNHELTESIAKLSKIKFEHGVAFCTKEELERAIDKFLKS